MAATLNIVLPVFALIVIGYICGTRGWISGPAAKGLADFTFLLAVPALLFRTVATTELPTSALAVWASFFGAAVVTWILAAAITALLLRRPAQDGASIAMSSGYGNVVMLGIPLATNAYGDAATVPIAILLSIHSPALWLLGSLHMASVSIERESSLVQVIGSVVKDLAGNPIILAVVAGTVWRLSGLAIPTVADRTLAMLAQASVPASLVALGLGLIKFEIKGQLPTLTTILVLKLVAMPLVAAALAVSVFELDPVSAGVVVLFAAMPTGANAFLFANKHQRAMNSASGAVAISTALSAVVAAAIVFAMPR